MAEESNGASGIRTTSHIPIAQLTPLLPTPGSRSIKAVVTLTWPYSSATGSVAFLLSEPDFRLRRTRGQVRVQFSGSSAKEVAKSGIASGDQVLLSLDGVEWIRDEAAVATPGKGVEFELKFTERLVLQFQQEDFQGVKTIDIDHPASEAEVAAPPRIPTPELAISPSAASTQTSSAPPGSATKVGDEWISPAFIKRARTSYGSLFESDYDPFAEEDGTIRGKGRKRTRLSSTWRYSSRSPTPEADVESMVTAPDSVTKPAPLMTDEGCQTVGLEDGGAAEVLASFARQATNVGRDSYLYLNGVMARGELSHKEAPFRNNLNVTELDTFRTRHTEMNDLPRSETHQDALISTKFRPASSEMPPRASPLMSDSKNGPSTENVGSTEVNQGGRGLDEKPQAAHSDPLTEGEEAEDLYGASPAGRREEQSELAVPNFHNLAPTLGGLETSGFEDQYGHWQSTIAPLSHHASPYQAIQDVHEDAQIDRFYVQEGEADEQYTNNGFPTPHSEILHTHEYPELDDGLPIQQMSGWEPGIGNVPYPDLPDHIGRLEEGTNTYPTQPRSTAMSRSQSGQSHVVDLTESSDEENEQLMEDFIEEHGSILEEEEEEESLEGSVVDDEDGSSGKEPEEQPVEIVRSRHLPKNAFEAEEDFEREEDQDDQGDYYNNDELEEHEADTLRQKFNVGPGQEFYNDDEEGSYEEEDDDMEEDGAPARPPVQWDPVVIDLLSSGDEDDGQSAQLKSNISASPRPQASTNYSHEDQESDDSAEEGDSEDKNAIPYAERAELKTQMAPRNLARDDSVEEEDESGEEGIDEYGREDGSDSENDEEPSSQAESAMHNGQSSAHELLEESEHVHHVQNTNGTGNELVYAESDQYDDQHLQPEALNEPYPTEAEEHIEAAIPGQFGRPETTSEPGPFSRIPNIDGASDEPAVTLSYPVLPEDVPSPSASDHRGIFQTPDNHLPETRNAQLPTPEATQSTGKAISAETSFTSATGALPAQIELQLGSDVGTNKIGFDMENVTVDESELINVEVDADQREGTVVTVETHQIMVHEEDIEMGQDANLEAIADPKPDESGPLREQSMEEQLGLEATEPKSVESKPVEQPVEKELNSEAGEPELTNTQPLEEQIVQDWPSLEAREPESIEPQRIQETIVLEDPFTEITEESIVVDSNPTKKSENLDMDTKEPEFSIGSPRRSHRRVKSTVTARNTKEDVRPVTPKKAGNGVESVGVGQEKASPRVVLDSQAPPGGHDASIELALSSLESPSKQQHDLRKQPAADLKLRLSRALRTELSEFTALKVLRYHLNQKLDVLAVATTTPAEPLRAKNGPRHYQITFNVTDTSIAPSGVTEVQIFRPYKHALPTITAGDGVLLRNFQVISVKNRGFGLRSVLDEGSSWAVFKEEGDAEVRGPPVEFGDGERNHVIALKVWYGTLDAVAMAKISRANGDKPGATVGKNIRKAS